MCVLIVVNVYVLLRTCDESITTIYYLFITI